MAIDIYNGSINLPSEVSSEIWQKTQEDSAIMKLARQIQLPGNGVTIPVITGDPEAEWVGETDEKPVKRGSLETKQISTYTLAVIVPFSNQFKRDHDALYNALVERLPKALAKKFDATVFGAGSAPGSNFDTFASVTAQDFANPYAAMVAANLDIATHGGIMNGVVLSPQGNAAMLAYTDADGRPLFVDSVADGTIPRVLGVPTYQSKGAYITGSPNTVGIVGDWTQAVYGTVEGVKVAISDQATLTDGETTLNLFQRNMFAVRCEIEVGFRADLSVFNKLTKA